MAAAQSRSGEPMMRPIKRSWLLALLLVAFAWAKAQAAPPVANPDNYTVHANEVLTVSAGAGVIANDTDGDGEAISVIAFQQSSNGTVNMAADGSFTFTPNLSYVGTETLSYAITDGIEPTTGSFTLEVTNAAPVGSQNLLVNPNFHTDVSGWLGLGQWDPMDVNDSPTSGSATWINDSSGPGGALMRYQCVDTSDLNQEFVVSGYVFVPSGNTANGYTLLRLSFFSDTTCSDYVDGFDTPIASTTDTWQLLGLIEHTIAGTASVRVGVLNSKSEAGTFQVYADSLYFGPNPATIFVDGFESHDTSNWGAAVGLDPP